MPLAAASAQKSSSLSRRAAGSESGQLGSNWGLVLGYLSPRVRRETPAGLKLNPGSRIL